MGDISTNDKSMVVHNKMGPITPTISSSNIYRQFQPQKEQNHQGMLMWQSRLQEKLLKEQKDKRHAAALDSQQQALLETQQQEFRGGLREDDEQPQQFADSSSIKSPTLLFPKISSSVSFQNLAGVSREGTSTGIRQAEHCNDAAGGQLLQPQYPVLYVPPTPVMPNNNFLTTPAGPIPNQYFPGGCGAPRRSPSGKLLTNLQGHIDIRYHQKDTRGFEQSIRYQVDKDKIAKYKQDLDKQVEQEKSRRREKEPYYFSRRQKLPSKITSMKSEESDEGVELAPLLRTKVYSKSLPKLDNHYLSSTDVTSTFNFSPRRVQFYYTSQPQSSRSSVGSEESSASHPARQSENPYASILRQQTNLKKKQLENEKTFETVANEQHFSTWDSFWGRPGGGAPIYYTEEKHRKGDLWKLLHSSNRKK